MTNPDPTIIEAIAKVISERHGWDKAEWFHDQTARDVAAVVEPLIRAKAADEAQACADKMLGQLDRDELCAGRLAAATRRLIGVVRGELG